ncbi:MAG: restriction endonuclease subunit S [Acetobacter sp.]|nr:restriction endonuclease subunit S [Acetobacter sp.]
MQTCYLISSNALRNGKIPRISAKSDNNGILGYFNTKDGLDNARHYENFISVSFFGDVFYQPFEASVEMKVHVLKLKRHSFTQKTGLFFASAIAKCLRNRFTYGSQLSSSKLKNNNYFITLPTINNQIAFDFMQDLMTALSKQVVHALNAYTSLKIQTAKEVINK